MPSINIIFGAVPMIGLSYAPSIIGAYLLFTKHSANSSSFIRAVSLISSCLVLVGIVLQLLPICVLLYLAIRGLNGDLLLNYFFALIFGWILSALGSLGLFIVRLRS